MRKIFLIIALAIASFTFAEEAKNDSIQTVETETIEYIEQTTDSIQTSLEYVEQWHNDNKVIEKRIENGIMILEKNGHTYTVTGQLIN